MTRHRMDPGDAAWLHMERATNRMIVNSVMWFDEPLDRAALRQLVEERLIARFPHFSQRVVELPGFVWWEDVDALDLDKHLIHTRLTGRGDQADLQRYISRMLHRPLDLNRPLWELHLIDGYRGDGCAILARIHHCIADGIALSRVMLSLTDDPEDADRAGFRAPDDEAGGEQHHPHLLHAAIDRSEAMIGDLVHMAGAMAADVRHPSRAVDAIKHGTTGARTLTKLLALPPDTETALHGAAGLRK